MQPKRLMWALAAALLLTGDAAAVRAPEGLAESALEPAAGRGRRDAPIAWQTPPGGQRAWQQFTAAHGPGWRALWDLDRDVPTRVFGEGLVFPGASADAGAAEAAARRVLAAQLDLLAPGARPDDFALLTNVTHGPGGELRTVAFAQRHGGMAVLGGAVSFLFKRDRLFVLGSSAWPHLRASRPARLVADPAGPAVAWIERLYGARPRVLAVAAEPVVLPVPHERDDGAATIEHRVVLTVAVDLDEPGAPRGRWNVYVDAVTGAPVARAQTLRFGAGTLRFDAPVRYPGGGRTGFPASRAGITVDGAPQTTGGDGAFAFVGTGPASVTASTTGPLVRVTDNGAPGATGTVSVPDGGSGTWSAGADGLLDAQLSAFVHASLAKAYAKAELAPDLGWLDAQLEVSVNENGTCNAYSTGDDIHFFVAGDGCENTGRLADVIYHEFGHSLHAQSLVQGAGEFDAHMSEGTSDYLAATMVGDPGMGRGFLLGDGGAVRHLDPEGDEARYPDDMDSDPHVSGLIIGGALWDLRKAYIEQHGADAGRRMADAALMASLRRAVDIPSTYVEVLAADDDDGNLTNGTPNKCTIDRAFLPHGLVDLSLTAGVGGHVRDDLTVRVLVTPPGDACPAAAVTSAAVDWRVAGQVETQRVQLAAVTGGFEGAIPEQPEGAIVQYRVTVELGGGTQFVFPENAADPWYQFYAGPLIPLYCNDFETDPFAAGWTHAATGGTSDWRWGMPRRAPKSGDPAAAWSGANIVGMDLGMASDGWYEPGIATTLTSPVFDVSGRTGVRLQYRRWLGVEDGFYDDATILADGEVVWRNFAGPDEEADTHHLDGEWREHDVDLGAQAADGSVQVAFRLEADGGLEFGGWNLDDVCIMVRGRPGEVCGDGTIALDETCDDGNTVGGDGCSETCDTEFAPEPGGCCSGGGARGGGAAGPVLLGLLGGAAILRRRRPAGRRVRAPAAPR